MPADRRGTRLWRTTVSEAIVDRRARRGGQLRAFEREDGASNARFEIASGKANGAVALGMGSHWLMPRTEQQPYFIGAVAGAIGGAIVPVPGGVPVQSVDGDVIGAIGITGGHVGQ